MVTSCFKPGGKRAKKESFPLIAYHKLTGTYVLLTEEEIGTVLVSKNKEKIGHHCKEWNFGQCPEDWEVIPNAKITISN